MLRSSAQLGLGGVLVTVEYDVPPSMRRTSSPPCATPAASDSASRSGVCRDLEVPRRYRETFMVGLWDENLRQHERMTRADCSIEESLRAYVCGEPAVHHLFLPLTSAAG
jgi:hypothetical protein